MATAGGYSVPAGCQHVQTTLAPISKLRDSLDWQSFKHTAVILGLLRLTMLRTSPLPSEYHSGCHSTRKPLSQHSAHTAENCFSPFSKINPNSLFTLMRLTSSIQTDTAYVQLHLMCLKGLRNMKVEPRTAAVSLLQARHFPSEIGKAKPGLYFLFSNTPGGSCI